MLSLRKVKNEGSGNAPAPAQAPSADLDGFMPAEDEDLLF